eukprot:Pgem_evm1s20107
MFSDLKLTLLFVLSLSSYGYTYKTTPTRVSRRQSCTPQDGDPYSTGTLIPCCDGLEMVLDFYYSNTVKSYECKPVATSTSSTPVPTSTDALEFPVLGDWGWTPTNYGGPIQSNGLQIRVSDSMKSNTWNTPNALPSFVLNVGDSFYMNGVSSSADSQWNDHWYNIYGSDLCSVAWYSVMGNHDLGPSNECVCSTPENVPANSVCPQVNPVLSQFSNANWVMKGRNYIIDTYVESHNTLIINLDTNFINSNEICKYTTGSCNNDNCKSQLTAMKDVTEGFLQQALDGSTADTVIVNNHYPYNWGGMIGVTNILKTFANKYSSKRVLFYGGHVHLVERKYTDNYGAGLPNNIVAYTSGGGGGYGCDNRNEQGFVSVRIETNGTVSRNDPVLTSGSGY